MYGIRTIHLTPKKGESIPKVIQFYPAKLDPEFILDTEAGYKWLTYHDAMKFWMTICHDKLKKQDVRRDAANFATLWIDIDSEVKEALTGMEKSFYSLKWIFYMKIQSLENIQGF